jgi:hypothetical protein
MKRIKILIILITGLSLTGAKAMAYDCAEDYPDCVEGATIGEAGCVGAFLVGCLFTEAAYPVCLYESTQYCHAGYITAVAGCTAVYEKHCGGKPPPACHT